MPRATIPKERRIALKDARRIIKQVLDMNGNEAETRRRVERIFDSVMGYDVFKHLSRERAVKGSAETEHVDFAIQLEPGIDARPLIMVELKKVGTDLARKHLKQVTSYAINAGCEWILLTNGREWKVYHVEFSQPPEVELLESWNLLEDDISELHKKFELISFKSVKKDMLNETWHRTKVFAPDQLLEAIVSDQCLNAIRRYLYKNTGVRLKYEEIYSGINKLLNEKASQAMSNIKIPQPKQRTRRISSPSTNNNNAESLDNDLKEDSQPDNTE
jgi:hypothetical protein